jgi:hypothetical protein
MYHTNTRGVITGTHDVAVDRYVILEGPGLSNPRESVLADSATMANLPAGYLRSEMLSLPSAFDDRFDLSSSLKLKWNKDDRYQLLRSALGYVVVGGEAYMVYRALKKYRYIR